jgi:hypothetical protein
MKASPNSTVPYKNSIHTISAVRTTLTYVTSATYSRGYCIKWRYEPYLVPNHILPIWSINCWYIGSISSKPLLEKQCSVRITDGKANLPQFAEDPYLLTFLSQRWGTDNTIRYLGLVMLESKYWQKIVLQIRADYAYIHTSSHLITPI